MLGYAGIGVSLICLVLSLTWGVMPCLARKISYSGQHIFITGGSTGIGLALAYEFLNAGSSVTIVARTRSKMDKALEGLRDIKKVKGLTGEIYGSPADVTNQSQVSQPQPRDSLLAAVIKTFQGCTAHNA